MQQLHLMITSWDSSGISRISHFHSTKFQWWEWRNLKMIPWLHSESLDLVFNLSSLFKKTGYEVKSVVIDRAVVNAIVRKEGTVNWDVMKDTTQAVAAAEPEPAIIGNENSSEKSHRA